VQIIAMMGSKPHHSAIIQIALRNVKFLFILGSKATTDLKDYGPRNKKKTDLYKAIIILVNPTKVYKS